MTKKALDELVAWLCLEPLSAAFLPLTVLEAAGGLDVRTNLLGASAFFLKEMDWENNELPMTGEPVEDNLKENNNVS